VRRARAAGSDWAARPPAPRRRGRRESVPRYRRVRARPRRASGPATRPAASADQSAGGTEGRRRGVAVATTAARTVATTSAMNRRARGRAIAACRCPRRGNALARPRARRLAARRRHRLWSRRQLRTPITISRLARPPRRFLLPDARARQSTWIWRRVCRAVCLTGGNATTGVCSALYLAMRAPSLPRKRGALARTHLALPGRLGRPGFSWPLVGAIVEACGVRPYGKERTWQASGS